MLTDADSLLSLRTLGHPSIWSTEMWVRQRVK